MFGLVGVEEVTFLLLVAGFLLVTVCGFEGAALVEGAEEGAEETDTTEELAGSEEGGSAEEVSEESGSDPTESELRSGETGICCPPQPASSSKVKVKSAAQSAKDIRFIIIFIVPLFLTKINCFCRDFHWKITLATTLFYGMKEKGRLLSASAPCRLGRRSVILTLLFAYVIIWA